MRGRCTPEFRERRGMNATAGLSERDIFSPRFIDKEKIRCL